MTHIDNASLMKAEMGALPTSPKPRLSLNAVLGIAACLLFLVSPLVGIPGWTLNLATLVLLGAISLLGLNLIYGLAGMLSLGHAAFSIWPIYVAAVSAKYGVPLPIAVLIGLTCGAILATLLGRVFVRLPGMYFAIGTLGFSFVSEGLARAFPGLSGGASGMVLTLPVALDPNVWYGISIAALSLAIAVYVKVTSGARNRTLVAVKSDELSAQVLGIRVASVKLRVFVIGSMFAGVSGILMGFYVGIVVPESGGVTASLSALATVIIGGAGTVLGPVVGNTLIQWLFAVAGSAARFEQLLYGAVFLGIVLFMPRGIVGSVVRSLGRGGKASTDKGEHGATLAGPVPKRITAQRAAPGVCLKVEDISKSYGGLKAVDRMSLEINSGEIVALLGPNGAGKSTFFNLINGVVKPDTGAVLIRGRDVARLEIHEFAHTMGRSFQTPRLCGEMTVEENLLVRVDALFPDMLEAEKDSVARDQLRMFGLEGNAGTLVSSLGVGLHKLIDVARAAVGLPELILLDEPAVGLTTEELRRLRDMLVRLQQHGTAVVLVEHNFGFVREIADRVVVMDQGKLIASGSVEDVYRDESVKAAYFGAL
ncbi:MAG TPA: ATP-binding cassette domain-containing protein [Ramlibacter sp.]|nr:ATP-binding cassette domain-containing protein [Ramlibacter sp.]